jgi:uncharacterized protein YuzE
MKYSNSIFVKKVIVEDYLPLLIKSPEISTDADYLLYRKGDNSLLELVFDATTHNVHKICLVICKEYEITSTKYTPPTDFVIGDVLVDTPDDIAAEVFRCRIYTDAIQLKLSNQIAETTIVSKDIVWELDSKGDLISITAYNQSAEVINHTLKELNC